MNSISSTPLLDLTIAIPVRNEARNLPLCLEAIGADFASRVVVIDSHSADDTARVAIGHGVELLSFDWDGRFPKKRNWFLRNHPPTTTWILFLDADEWLTPAVKQEIAAKLPQATHSGFWLSYSIYFLGRRLRGGYPLRKLALFRVGSGEYERIDELHWSQCDMEVHEHPILCGSIGTIQARIDHRDLRGVDSYVAKHSQYAAWEAHRLLSSRSQPGLQRQWTRSQRLKYRLLASPWGGLVFFLGSYFWMGGWRDGSVGFAFAMLKASYFVQIACRLMELQSGALSDFPSVEVQQ